MQYIEKKVLSSFCRHAIQQLCLFVPEGAIKIHHHRENAVFVAIYSHQMRPASLFNFVNLMEHHQIYTEIKAFVPQDQINCPLLSIRLFSSKECKTGFEMQLSGIKNQLPADFLNQKITGYQRSSIPTIKEHDEPDDLRDEIKALRKENEELQEKISFLEKNQSIDESLIRNINDYLATNSLLPPLGSNLEVELLKYTQ